MKTSTLLKSIIMLCILNSVACKSDSTNNEKDTESLLVETPTESEKHLQNITRAHNAKKFQSEPQVKFKLQFSTKDSVFFDGFVTLKTDGSKARFLNSKIDRVIQNHQLQTDLDKKLFLMAELYSMGFWIKDNNFKLLSNNDSLDLSYYRSSKSESTFKIYSHPITHVVQQVDYDTNIDQKPFKSGSLHYEKYITVNRVPVALHWNIIDDKDTIAQAEISRISYPEQF